MTIDELHKIWDEKSESKRHLVDHEHKLQVKCVQWFRLVYPNLLIYAIPNGGQRNLTTAKKLKAEGATAGIPDLHIPTPRQGYASLYIEMKNGTKGRVSDKQKDIHEALQSQGNKVVVCRTFEEFQQEITNYLN